VALDGALTAFGPLSLRTESALDASGEQWVGSLTLTVSQATPPPDGYRWRLPQLPDRVDGSATVEDGWLIMPDAGAVTLVFGR
jgi:hypothetical protein